MREIAYEGGLATCAHRYEDVSVLQADLVGFTVLSATMKPKMLMQLLGDLFKQFDELCELHSVQKLKTIGDAYIATCGAFGEGSDEELTGITTSVPNAPVRQSPICSRLHKHTPM